MMVLKTIDLQRSHSFFNYHSTTHDSACFVLFLTVLRQWRNVNAQKKTQKNFHKSCDDIGIVCESVRDKENTRNFLTTLENAFKKKYLRNLLEPFFMITGQKNLKRIWRGRSSFWKYWGWVRFDLIICLRGLNEKKKTEERKL